MSVTRVQAATGSTTNPNVGAGLGVAPTQNNLLVAIVTTAGVQTLVAQGAWTKLTQIQSTDTAALFWKIAGAGESAAQTVSSNPGSSAACTIVEFSSTNGFDTAAISENAQASTTTSKTTPTLTPTAGAPAAVVCGAMSDGARTYSSQAISGSNLGSTTDDGTASRGTATAGESVDLWDAVCSALSGSYSGSVTCSAADGGSGHIGIFPEVTGAAQDTPELDGRPFGLSGQRQMHQLLSQ